MDARRGGGGGSRCSPAGLKGIFDKEKVLKTTTGQGPAGYPRGDTPGGRSREAPSPGPALTGGGRGPEDTACPRPALRASRFTSGIDGQSGREEAPPHSWR